MPLFETLPVDHEQVRRVVLEFWDLELGKVLKASQNHTFVATARSNPQQQFAVRVTPDPSNANWQRINDEIFFVNYVVGTGECPHVCQPVRATKAAQAPFVVRDGDLTIVVINWAKGEMLNFMQYRWMTDATVVRSWGRFFGNLHRVSRRFSAEHPEIAKRIQRWDQVHDSILAGSEIHADDEAVVSDPLHYGVLHGDLNCSNFFYMEQEQQLCVFDWDQTQRGWYLADLAQAMISSKMLQEGGSLIDGSEVKEANPEQFQQWMLEGYQEVTSESELAVIDKARLARMIDLRISLYDRFCRRAATEFVPDDMKFFIKYVNEWFDRVNKKKQGQQ